jgi:hypothetical protein
MADKIKLQTPIPRELNNELGERAKSMGISKASLVVICLRSGLDVIKVSLSADYAKLMELLSKEYEKQEH